MAVVIETTLGDFTVDLYIEDRPNTCKNFLKLCKTKYYNFCLFHSVQHNFIAQTGDPTGTGKGGESIFGKIYGEEKKFFEAEMLPKIKHSRSGLLSMVNCGNNMLGSQFFVTLTSELQSLDSEHCVFGEITEGQEILLKLNDAICDTEHRPYQDIRITHTVILEDPFDDPEGLVVPDFSPEPSKETLINSRIAPDEELDETKGKTAEELEEITREREAKAQATILEIVGDLPDAEVAPPENVLFVCKLNPVTTDDDLEIIFSRFGKVNSCEVIRDRVTGDSLQYAFVEFENQKACEDAFFKMDNVLIDDRRIHVDFSQSVSKLRWKGKGRGVEHIDDKINTNRDSSRNMNSVKDHTQSKSEYIKKENGREFSKGQNMYKSSKSSESQSRKNYRERVRDSDEDDNDDENEKYKSKRKSDQSEEYKQKRSSSRDYPHSHDYRSNYSHDSRYSRRESRDHRHGRSPSDKVTTEKKHKREDDNISRYSNRKRESCIPEENSIVDKNYQRERNSETLSHSDRDVRRFDKRDDSNDIKRTYKTCKDERDTSYEEESSSRSKYKDENRKTSDKRKGDSSEQQEPATGKDRGENSRSKRDGNHDESVSRKKLKGVHVGYVRVEDTVDKFKKMDDLSLDLDTGSAKNDKGQRGSYSGETLQEEKRRHGGSEGKIKVNQQGSSSSDKHKHDKKKFKKDLENDAENPNTSTRTQDNVEYSDKKTALKRTRKEPKERQKDKDAKGEDDSIKNVSVSDKSSSSTNNKDEIHEKNDINKSIKKRKSIKLSKRSVGVLPRKHSKSKKKKGEIVKKKKRSRSSSSSSSCTTDSSTSSSTSSSSSSSSISNSSTSSSTDSSSSTTTSSSSDAEAKVNRAKQKKLLRKVSRKKTVSKKGKKQKGRKVKQSKKRSRKQESSSEDSDSDTSSSSPKLKHQHKRSKKSKRIR